VAGNVPFEVTGGKCNKKDGICSKCTPILYIPIVTNGRHHVGKHEDGLVQV